MINVQHLRGNSSTTPTAGVYTGPAGELMVDEDLWGIRVQDGVTPGGHLLSAVGSAIVDMIAVNTGTTNTITTLTVARTEMVWRSTTAGAKTQVLPDPAAWDGYEVTIKLTVGDGTVFTISAAAGTVEGQASVDTTDVTTIPRTSLTFRAQAANNDWLMS